MAYASGTILSATPSTALVAAIEAQLTAHAGWEFVEEYVDATYTNRVWRCKGTSNSQGADYHLALMRLTATIGTSAVTIKAAEGYDPAAHMATNGVGSAAARVCDATSAATMPNPTLFSASTLFTGVVLATTTSTFNYFISVTKDALTVALSTAAHGFHVGLFDPYWATQLPAQEFPLLAQYLNGGTNVGSVSRAAGYAGVSAGTGTQALAAGTASAPMGIVGTASPVYGADAVGARQPVIVAGDHRGTYRDLLYFMCPSAAVLGDTIIVDGQTWALIDDLGSGAIFVNTEAP